MLNFRRQTLLILALSAVAMTAQAQQSPSAAKDPDLGGLGGYTVPGGVGGAPEYNFCVMYAKRTWHLTNMIDEGELTVEQAKQASRKIMGENAAREEIADFTAFEDKTYASGNAMAGARFYRCAEKLQLNPQSSHRAKAETCFSKMRLLEYAARQRNAGKNRDQVQAAIKQRIPTLPADFLSATLNLAYGGARLSEGNTIIEDVFNDCFSRNESGAK